MKDPVPGTITDAIIPLAVRSVKDFYQTICNNFKTGNGGQAVPCYQNNTAGLIQAELRLVKLHQPGNILKVGNPDGR